MCAKPWLVRNCRHSRGRHRRTISGLHKPQLTSFNSEVKLQALAVALDSDSSNAKNISPVSANVAQW
jgi:hypothetical protein